MSNVLTQSDIKSFKISDIPEAYRPQVTNFNQYLIDGALKTWNGNMADVYSPSELKMKMVKCFQPF